MEKYDILFILHFPSGMEATFAKDIEMPLAEKIAQVKKDAGGLAINWSAFRGKRIFALGTINPINED